MRGMWAVALSLLACGCQNVAYRQLCGGNTTCGQPTSSSVELRNQPTLSVDDKAPPAFPSGSVRRENPSTAPIVEVRRGGQEGSQVETQAPQDVQINLAKQKIIIQGNPGCNANQSCARQMQPQQSYPQAMQPYPQQMMPGGTPMMMMMPYPGMTANPNFEDSAPGGSLALGMRIMRLPIPVPRLFRVPATPAVPAMGMMMPMQMAMPMQMPMGMPMQMQMPMGMPMQMPMGMPMMAGGMMATPSMAMGAAAVQPAPVQPVMPQANINMTATPSPNLAATLGMLQAAQSTNMSVNVQPGGQLQTRDPAVEELARNLMMLDILLRERAGNPNPNGTPR